MRDIFVIGAGGFGRETVGTIQAINHEAPVWRIIGVVDDSPDSVNLERIHALGLHHVGGVREVPTGASVALCVGRPSARARLVQSLSNQRVVFPSLIHPSTEIGSQFRHGTGLITLAGVSIGTNVTLGDHVHLNAHAVIGHDVSFESFVSVNPNATVSGEVTVGRECLLGAASVVLQGLDIGQGATVGAGSVVTRHVAAASIVKGVPAR